MKSVRLGEELERRLERAADASGTTASEIVRRAVREQCDRILASTVYEALGGFVGCASDARPGRQRRSEFGDYLLEKHAPERRRTLGAAPDGEKGKKRMSKGRTSGAGGRRGAA